MVAIYCYMEKGKVLKMPGKNSNENNTVLTKIRVGHLQLKMEGN